SPRPPYTTLIRSEAPFVRARDVPEDHEALHHGVQRLAAVRLEAEPGVLAEVAAQRRAAARHAVVVGGADAVHVVAGPEPPLVGQLAFEVDVAAAVDAQAVRGPVVPLVEVHEQATVELRRLEEVEAEPVAVR